MNDFYIPRFLSPSCSFTYDELGKALAKLQPRLNEATEAWLAAKRDHGSESPEEHALWPELDRLEMAKARILREANRLDKINGLAAAMPL
ncbi:hypothetical protein SEA_SULLEY_90 [Mycobacterium phage Sulley]|uniref:Uncharacterized protein n=2 Tax=Anayavirus angelica TaxID=861044 RepID=A0A2D2W3T1_9CAUD|nr:hypothetical protein ANGELICA_90 [Mycobacterium phage Angelica]ADL71179.1 hypothetical protein ANGELICA_90 [Mycobacterium phage Angelica]ATS92838.1 hypothetical protein SEA_SULLEY_90 [Mycobacterium phage Sulley]